MGRAYPHTTTFQFSAFSSHALAYSFEPTVFEKSSNIGGLWRFDPDPEGDTFLLNFSSEC